jgi:DNA polymerase III epsilon subunit-like protein
VECSVVRINDGEIGTAQSWLVKPKQRIMIPAVREHGVTNELVADAPPVEEVAGELREALADATALVAHLEPAHMEALSQALPGGKPRLKIDPLRLARALYPDQEDYSAAALAGLLETSEHLGEPGCASHTATVFAHLFVQMINSIPGPVGLPDLHAFGSRKDDSRPLRLVEGS